jgi:hypothetical protein
MCRGALKAAKGGIAMQCPYFAGKKIMTCMVNGDVYVPSISELEQYCRNENYKECPLLRSSANAKKSPPDPADGTRGLGSK